MSPKSFFYRVLRRIFYYKKTRIYKILAKDSPFLKPDVNVEIVAVGENNLKDALAMNFEETIVLFRQMFEDGELGFYAYCDNVIVHHSWAIMGPKVIIPPTKGSDACFEIDGKSAYIHYCVTDKNWRGRGIYPFVLSEICRILHEKFDCENVFITITGKNPPSARGILKAQFSECSNFIVFNFFGLMRRKIRAKKYD